MRIGGSSGAQPGRYRTEGAPFETFVETLRRDGFRALDIEAAPDFEPDEMIKPGNGHWNEIGHAFVAKRLLLIKDVVPR